MADLPNHPAINPETRPFWQAAADGRLLVKRCSDCGRHHHYPRALCPYCQSPNTEWRQSSGRGTIYSYSIGRRATPPSIVAYVTLEEGVTIFSNIVDASPDSVRISMPVIVAFESAGGITRPVFRPA